MRTFAFLCALALAARADEVVLKSGGRFSGVVEEKDNRVVVRTEHGAVTFDRAQVASIDRGKGSPLQEYEERRGKADLSRAAEVEALIAWTDARRMGEAGRELRQRLCRLKFDALDVGDDVALAGFAAWSRANGCADAAEVALRGALALRKGKLEAKDAEGRWRLGLWARSNGLAADAVVLFQEAVERDPEHEHARRALGFQRFQGAWMTERETRIAQGLLEFEGGWVTPATKEAVIAARTLEKERKLIEEERRRMAQDRALAAKEHQARLAELDARAAEIARRAAEIERIRTAEPPVVVVLCAHPGCGIATPHSHPPRPPK